MKPVDCHAHLDFEQFDEDREEVIKDIQEKMEFTVVPGIGFESNREVLELVEKYQEILKANLGIHPVYTDKFDQVEKVKRQVKEENPVAIGEIGLDHHHIEKQSLRDRQEDIFRQMLSLAEEIGRPVVIHSRDAEAKVLDILEDYHLENVMMHCFNGNLDLAKEAVSRGYHIGITTQVLYSTEVQNNVKEIPLENILLETDSPYLYRGERNEPVNVEESAQKISELKEISYETVVDQTSLNAREFFG